LHGYLRSSWSSLTSFAGSIMSVEGHDANMRV
jgi:hypothetical protein